MKNITSVMLVLIIGGLIFSCSSGSNGKKTEEELYTLAQEYSEKRDFESAIETYKEILKAYPDSPRVYKAESLMVLVYEEKFYTLAQEYSEKQDFQSAIETYQELLKTYPDSPRVYKAQFLIGFVYSENLKDYEKAKENYRKVIEKYPDCDLADDAKYMLETMEEDSLPIMPDTSAGSPN